MDKYAFLLNGQDLADQLVKRIKTHIDYVRSSGLATQWEKNQAFYENNFYGAGRSNDITAAGEQGELLATSFNHFRNILRHIQNQLTSQVPSYTVSANNSDPKSRRAKEIGESIVDYYFKVKRVKTFMDEGAEYGIVTGDGWLACEWSPLLGNKITQDNDRVIYEGDFDFESFGPDSVFFDPKKKNKRNLQWIIFRRRKNKWDLAKMFPKKKSEIIGLGPCADLDYSSEFQGYTQDNNEDTDIWVYSMYHKASPAIPDGKYCIFVADSIERGIMLYEGKNIYREHLPIFSISPAKYLKSPFGFTEANILRGPQEIINMVISATTTMGSTWGVANLWTPTGSPVTVEEVSEGMNNVSSDQKPEILQLFQDNPALYNLLNLSVSTIETLSGQNSVVRGNIENTQLKSGIALATVINMAQQYGQGLISTYYEAFEDVASFLINGLQKFANTERLIEIAGKSKEAAVRTFTADDISPLTRVTIDKANPIAKMPAGAMEIGLELTKMGKLSVEQFYDIVHNGKLSVATTADDRMLDYVAAVKSALLEGKKVPAIPGINPGYFMKEIHGLLMDLNLTLDPSKAEIVNNIRMLINDQMNLLREGDQLAALIHGGQLPQPEPVGINELNVPPELSGTDINNIMASQSLPAGGKPPGM